MKCCSFCLILVLEICLISYRSLCDAGDLLVNQKVSNDRLLHALKSAPKDQRLDRELCSAAEKLSEGKRLKSLEFDEVYALIFKPGPCLKYINPEKWERVSRDSLHES